MKQLTYSEEILSRFPCPVGYRELNNKDDNILIYDRTTLRPVTLTGWKDMRWINIKHTSGLIVSTVAVWYVVKHDEHIEYEIVAFDHTGTRLFTCGGSGPDLPDLTDYRNNPRICRLIVDIAYPR